MMISLGIGLVAVEDTAGEIEGILEDRAAEVALGAASAAPSCPASGHPSRARDVVLCIEAGGITVEATASPELLSELDRHAPAPDGRRG